LGREPENERAIEHHQQSASWDALRRAFLTSREFRRNFDRASRSPEVTLPQLEIVMTEREKILFIGLLQCARNYLEFGSGGSTLRAAESVPGKIVSIDSSQKWLDTVQEAIPPSVRPRTTLLYIDIGPVGEWGHPIASNDGTTFGRYSRDIWESVDGDAFDLFLIDGRFRVACFAETIRYASPSAFILVHDYVARPQYHVMESIARKVAVVDQLALFAPTKTPSNLIDSVSNAYRSVPD
jgi:hypothetical protein